MDIKGLKANNLHGISCTFNLRESIGIAGLSGSGKSTFCSTLSKESLMRVVTLLPKSEYRFLFSNLLTANFTAVGIRNLPMIFYLGKTNFNSNPRSTVGTHTGIFKIIREYYASRMGKTAEAYSFNNSLMWCKSCKGRGSIAGNICKSCEGHRYDKEILKDKVKTTLGELSIVDVNHLSIEQLLSISDELSVPRNKQQILKNLISLQVGYLSLERIMSSLSGGETVRVLLAEFMAECRDSLVIIDEISIGLDHNTLVNVLSQVSLLGNHNDVWLIDHSDTVLDATKTKIYFGPGSGKNGGQLVAKSPRPKSIDYPINKLPIGEEYELIDLKKRNIQISSLNIPKNRIITITGESGCGKSTLVKDCIVPYFSNNYKKVICTVIGQDRNQTITSKSTIATFLGVKKRLDKLPAHIYYSNLEDICSDVKKDKSLVPIIGILIDLGLGYLSFNRQIQTLSTGEFQCIHLVSNLIESCNEEMLLIFDEPSKGLSQNILNLFMNVLRKIVEDPKKTILLIEHNAYLLRNSDYIIDFGKRKFEPITSLTVTASNLWYSNYEKKQLVYEGSISSMIETNKFGLKHIYDEPTKLFSIYDHQFKGGLLKNLSPTARWIYKDYQADTVLPIIAIDFEGNLYSSNTLLFEILNITSAIINLSGTNDISSFDILSSDNRCVCCKGNGEIESFDIDNIIKDRNCSFGNGLLVDDVMLALKNYNLSKFSFFFKEIKKVSKYDLTKTYTDMSDVEKNIFWYGYWEKSFYDSNKKTQRVWKGLVYLIKKYMKSSKSIYKNVINASKYKLTCPICEGIILNHKKELLIDNKELRVILSGTIGESWDILGRVELFKRLSQILGKNIPLNFDISKLPQHKQVALKALELEVSSLYAYTIALKNSLPFEDEIKLSIESIAKNNEVICIDYKGVAITKEALLTNYFNKGKKKRKSFVYEQFGFKKISTEINSIRKSNPCPVCGGKGVLREESIFEGVDITETPCTACKKTGISKDGYRKMVQGIAVSDWLFGTVDILNMNINDDLRKIPLMCKIEDLDKYQLMALHEYKEA